MADKYLVLLVFGVVYVNCAVLKGKAFYCRDPETGKLHAVNTTWTTSSFCGNYTCNLRKRDMNLTSTAPIREFNVTNDDINETKDVNVTIQKRTGSLIQPLLHKTISPNPRNIFNGEDSKSSNEMNNIPSSKYYNDQEENESKVHNCKNQESSNLSSDNDRYLTDKEINSIADLLHEVKKSDLDAIVDIYNLAQDIYKEMDEATTAEIMTENLNLINVGNIHRNRETKTLPYWYDPLAYKEGMSERLNMNGQNTINVISTENPKMVPPKYFNGRLLNNDIGQTPYYYPVTQFQRISSYTHPSYSYKATTQNTDINRKSEVRNDIENRNSAVNTNVGSTKLIEPSYYLPYPFANIHSYNLTESRNSHYGNPWMLDYYNRYRYYQPYYNAYKEPIQKAILINPHLNNEVHDVEQHTAELVEAKKDNSLKDKDLVDTLLGDQMSSSWKTGPVSAEVLKDIRAEIDTSRLLKAFPLRKKIKLEKVGKLMNVDDLNTPVYRNKRFTTDNLQKNNMTVIDEFETYLERVTCQDQIRLGYFRMGNATQPFPECCPQLIDTR